jgi:uncharacterized protein (UPF0335 family)
MNKIIIGVGVGVGVLVLIAGISKLIVRNKIIETIAKDTGLSKEVIKQKLQAFYLKIKRLRKNGADESTIASATNNFYDELAEMGLGTRI